MCVSLFSTEIHPNSNLNLPIFFKEKIAFPASKALFAQSQTICGKRSLNRSLFATFPFLEKVSASRSLCKNVWNPFALFFALKHPIFLNLMLHAVKEKI